MSGGDGGGGGGGGGDGSPTTLSLVSDAMGWTYAACWLMSVFPQVVRNYRGKSVRGLSFDFVLFHLVAHTSYFAYNMFMKFSPVISALYAARHGGAHVPVHNNDVAFSAVATAMAWVTLWQTRNYDSGDPPQRFTRRALLVSAAVVLLVVMQALRVARAADDIMTLMTLLGSIKIIVTVMKYIPQVLLNIRRRSTEGFAVLYPIGDFGGAFFSAAQMLVDVADHGSFDYIAGNLPKFGLSIVCLAFSSTLLFQHFVVYNPQRRSRGAGAGGGGEIV